MLTCSHAKGIMPSFETILVISAVLLVLSVLASKASSWTGVPALLLFITIGMLAGSDGPGGIVFDQPELTQSIGVVALVFILFSGGLDTDWAKIKPILAPSLVLANVGVVISAALVGAFATLVFGFDPLTGLLLGAIVSSTDAAAVFSVMRSRAVRLKGDLEPLIELESGSNDPVAVFLTIGVTGLIAGSVSFGALAIGFVVQMAVGAIAGYGFGRLMVFAINRIRLRQEGLYPALTIALVLLAYAGTALVGGNGFLAVYIAGLVMGNRDFVHHRSLARFHDGIAWLMQIAMFLTLGLQVYPSRLLPIALAGLLVSAFLIFVARPVSVFLALAPWRFTIRDKALVSWTGLRGAVPIVLATYPLLAGIPNADTIFHLVFFIVLTSVLLQGTTIPAVAQWLGLQDERTQSFHYPHEFVPTVGTSSQLIELRVLEDSPVLGQALMDLGLPSGVLVVSLTRDGDMLTPSGATIFEPHDRVLVVADRAHFDRLKQIFATIDA
jgi:potassium/hydrogen antiporter